MIDEKGRLDSEVSIQALQLELILGCMEQYRSFKVSNRNKRVLIGLAAKIFDMLIKYKPPQKTTPLATQGPVSGMNIIAAFVDTLPLKLRSQVVAYVRKQD